MGITLCKTEHRNPLGPETDGEKMISHVSVSRDPEDCDPDLENLNPVTPRRDKSESNGYYDCPLLKLPFNIPGESNNVESELDQGPLNDINGSDKENEDKSDLLMTTLPKHLRPVPRQRSTSRLNNGSLSPRPRQSVESLSPRLTRSRQNTGSLSPRPRPRQNTGSLSPRPRQSVESLTPRRGKGEGLSSRPRSQTTGTKITLEKLVKKYGLSQKFTCRAFYTRTFEENDYVSDPKVFESLCDPSFERHEWVTINDVGKFKGYVVAYMISGEVVKVFPKLTFSTGQNGQKQKPIIEPTMDIIIVPESRCFDNTPDNTPNSKAIPDVKYSRNKVFDFSESLNNHIITTS